MTSEPRFLAGALPAPQARGRHWLPHQHGAWAMLAVPLLLGVAASRPSAWQLVLAAAAVLGYLASATAQSWLRTRRREALPLPPAVYGAGFGVLGLALAVAFPALLLALLVLVPTGALVMTGARPGTRRDVVNSLAQALQALVLVPAAAWVSGAFDPGRVAIASGVGAAFLLGTVLVVRSALRQRGSTSFAALSVGFHGALLVPAALLGAPWVVLAIGLTARAAGIPYLAWRRTGTPRPLKPVHVGAVEALASIAVVVVACVAIP